LVATTTTVGSSANPSSYGANVTFTATVSPSAASGTVTFKDGATTLGTGTLSGGTATFATSDLSAGSHNITAEYAGDDTYAASTSSALSQMVDKATPSVTTWPTATPITYGQTLASSTLSGGAASVAGSFAFTTPGTAPGAGTASHEVTFTPTDTANYNTVSGTASVTVNATGNAPVAVNDTLGTVKNQAISLPGAKLAANDTDADGDALTVAAVSTPSTVGGTVALAAGNVTYTPATDFTGADSFTYTVSDGHGNTAIGTVNVTITSSTGVSLNRVYGPVVDNGEFVVRFAGTPGYTYTIEYTDSLVEPINWQNKTNLTAPDTAGSFGKGVFEFRESTGGAGSRYYRTVYPAY
jgi:hypothetical protein